MPFVWFEDVRRKQLSSIIFIFHTIAIVSMSSVDAFISSLFIKFRPQGLVHGNNIDFITISIMNSVAAFIKYLIF